MVSYDCAVKGKMTLDETRGAVPLFPHKTLNFNGLTPRSSEEFLTPETCPKLASIMVKPDWNYSGDDDSILNGEIIKVCRGGSIACSMEGNS